SSWCTGSFAGLLMFLNQGLQNGTSHEQGVAAGVYTIVRDATCTHSSTSISNLLVASFHEHDTNIT
ncbi:hypothetical protein, partial [Extensimonas perlucida]|uniref:hypothetical protein n=1 Tax=Extensimonas perlucida TaxID=2590786 RepID=UPI001C93117B